MHQLKPRWPQRRTGIAERFIRGLTYHAADHVKELLAVPCYADAIEEGAETEDETKERSRRSVLVASRSAWRRELERWKKEGELELVPLPAQQRRGWLPAKLSTLFGGTAPHPIEHPHRRQFDREELLMELLAAEYSDESPDDGALEGSGDDFED
ncbi:hypothetical protein EDD85DRAFT_791772 [Armillaria nabsnona]|nr:hypothetical protein EDD85DRAFT_791772 [Armillaria nabsnona]